MAVKKPLPPPPPRSLMTDDGKVSDRFDGWLRNLQQSIAGTIDNVDTVQSAQEAYDVTIEYPQNQDYPIEINAPYAYTITQVDSKCMSGSCTATPKIGATPLGGGANSVTTSLQSKTHTSANVVPLGNTTAVTISANSACNRLRLVFWITRT